MKLALRLLFAAAIACASVPAMSVATGAMVAADEREIAVGTELVATQDVTLHKAEIAKGSKVSVTKVHKRDGKLLTIDLALTDGHVVPKVQMGLVHTSFRVVD